ncbi:MAG: MBOAT family protein [Proteobacteria bacterium]|nr:MBOAT family protein [Pseudomonadota bacterium]MBU1056790.1 MBOAT family protein [Pseudomonadota bacterium]
MAGTDQRKERKILLAVGLVFNIGLLFYFKYANFFVEQVNGLLALAGKGSPGWLDIALPIGISFFTFQKISYLIDVYRNTARPATSFLSYAMYVSLFPQLIAGPIIRYHDVAKQLVSRNYSIERLHSGICRFSFGLAKKVLIANGVGKVADAVFAIPGAELSPQVAWLGALCYTIQIYFDFSGYSDMAIGLGRMFGFDYLENFNQPYRARNFTQFWRRWHISLSNWMREYLYIPLGGNRKGTFRLYLNLWIVFLLSGFWHGASWNFIVWGAFHGFFLSFDKLKSHWNTMRLPPFLAQFTTFVLLMVSWVLFRSENLRDAWFFVQRMFLLTEPLTGVLPVPMEMIIDSSQVVMLLVGIGISVVPIPSFLKGLTTGETEIQSGIAPLGIGVASLIVFVIAVSELSIANYNPFIYFRF